MTALGVVAAWISPVVLSLLTGGTFAGDAEAPLTLLLALLAPLIALLRASAAGNHHRDVVGSACAVTSVGLVLAANLTVLGELAVASGQPRWAGALAAATVALGAALPRDRARGAVAAMPLGLVGVATVVLALAVIAGGPPWAAWSRVAARPALTFGERSPWVTEGRATPRPATVTFAEPHRVTVVAPGTHRVIERDGARVAVREWRLSPGDSLALRPGDQLLLEAGARVRFEMGKRVPGAPVSGSTWADPPGRSAARTLPHFLGAAVTWISGALLLVEWRGPPARAAAVGAPLVLLLFVLLAASWGVYAVDAAPELFLGASPLAPLVELSSLVAAPLGARALGAVVVMALVALHVTAACALRDRLGAVAFADSAPRGGPGALWGAICGGALVASLAAGDASRLFSWGLGLAASTGGARLVAGSEGRAGRIGASLGTLAFVGLAFSGRYLPAWVSAVGTYPALLAAPLAWGSVVVLARARRSRKGAR